MPTADVIVVGAGAAGAVVAARLSENPDREVVLLEAGTVGSDDGTAAGLLLRDASSLAASVHPRTSWSHPAELLPGRPWNLVRGRALGGSTAVNGGYFVRAGRADLAAWEAQLGWSPAAVVDAYRQCETDRDHPHAPEHGSNGPIQVARPPQDDAVTTSLWAAATGLGFPEVVDVSVDDAPCGVSAVPLNVTDGRRWDTGRAYLAPVAGRPNLAIVTGAEVLRIRTRCGPRGIAATGVVARVDGRPRLYEAAEVVLCAGAIGTAHLLLRSGLGPAAELERQGVAVVADLPVGRSTSDHPQVAVAWRPHPAGGPAVEPLRTVVTAGDLELLPLLRPTDELLGRPPRTGPVLDLLVADRAPWARGTLRLDPAAPGRAPIIRSGYLEDERDRATLRDGVRLAVSLLRASGAAREIVGLDEGDLDLDASLDTWVRSRVGTAQHLTGTAPAGPAGSPEAVTDPRGRVLGVAGLRVVDLSILPRVPSRGPAATAVMLGELLAGTEAAAAGSTGGGCSGS